MFCEHLNKILCDLKLHASKNYFFSEVPAGMQPLLALAYVSSTAQDTVIICQTEEEARSLESFALTLGPQNSRSLILLPSLDVEPYSVAQPAKKVLQTRMKALERLANSPTDRQKVLISTPGALFLKTLPRKFLSQRVLKIKRGQRLHLDTLIEFLTLCGYHKVETVSLAGEYAHRGDLLDVYGAAEQPLRLSFLGSEVESIRTFNLQTQVSEEALEEVLLMPAHELALSPKGYGEFFKRYELHFSPSAAENFKTSVPLLGPQLNNFLPLIYPGAESPLEYLAQPSIITLGSHNLAQLERGLLQEYEDAYNSLKKPPLSSTDIEHLKPQELLVSAEVLRSEEPGSAGQKTWRPSNFVHISASNYNSLDHTSEDLFKWCEIKLSASHLPTLASFNSEGNQPLEQLMAFLKSAPCYLQQRVEPLKGEGSGALVGVLLNFNTPSARSLLFKSLEEHGFSYQESLPQAQEGAPQSFKTQVQDGPRPNQVNALVQGLPKPKERSDFHIQVLNLPQLSEGFIGLNWIVICETDVFRTHQISAPQKGRGRKQKGLRSTRNIMVGDLLVHLQHGIGRYLGLVSLSIMNAEHDCLAIAYANNEKLYIPVENLDLLHKYGDKDSNTPLDKLGSGVWEKRKAAIKEKLEQLAYDLIKLAAARNLQEAPPIELNPEGYLEFCNDFPYIETEDQLQAIDDIRNDFAKAKVTDRLICGDVGFGKTEVAMRAAFLAAASGLQVAILAPTTLLVRQHYQNFVKRFQGQKFVIKQLSRFVTVSKKQEIKQGLAEGKVDIVIGTHSLLAKDIKFKSLGLLIIDEEQNFGVIHKERLKTMQEHIHTLVLTATPIPRTLQMSLTGVKELSMISTPPVKKLAVHTYVMPFKEDVIFKAIERELARAGQVFFISPLISELEELEDFIKNSPVEVKPLLMHGQMNPEQIEEGMMAFQDGKYNVLLATNIIESGIDLSNVNTIIINNADKFGLAQLYQLKGRVGRGSVQAYAYITYKGWKSLTPEAARKLDAIQSLNYLGAGFALAEQDLNIRGAGNILGKEQSGHIKGIGIELYHKFLSEEINRQKSRGSFEARTYDALSPNIALPISVVIPGKYINSVDERLQFYTRIASSTSFADLERISDELKDRYGPPPQEVANLFRLMKIKMLAKAENIDKLQVGSKGFHVHFYHQQPLAPDHLLAYIQLNSKYIKLNPDFSVQCFFRNTDVEAQITEVIGFLYALRNFRKIQDTN